jgi:multiple sugar transport system ATP-binding protein
MVLVGPSGSGKSTALRMVAGLEEITDGIIRIGGNVVNNLSPKERDIAMVFQNYALYPHMSSYENMEFGLKLRKTPKTKRQTRVAEAMPSSACRCAPRSPASISGWRPRRSTSPTIRPRR